jgi:hypothetical protein
MGSETAAVLVPADDTVLSSIALTEALNSAPAWREGRVVRVVHADRIGEDFGFSGRIDRVVIEAASGRTLSLVVKRETAEAVKRELLVRSNLGDREWIPGCYVGLTDDTADRGVLIIEDIAPAVQGDVLGGCTMAGAEAAVHALARLHSTTWMPGENHSPDLPRWGAAPMEDERWRDRLGRAAAQFPDILPARVAARLRDLPARVGESLALIRKGPAAWIHADAHLDNVLWRPDGSAVLLDWCCAAIGPPAVDVTHLLNNGVEHTWRQSLFSTYAAELERNGIDLAAADVEMQTALVLPHLLQGLVGWAGRPNFAPTGRPAAACRSSLRSVIEAVEP